MKKYFFVVCKIHFANLASHGMWYGFVLDEAWFTNSPSSRVSFSLNFAISIADSTTYFGSVVCHMIWSTSQKGWWNALRTLFFIPLSLGVGLIACKLPSLNQWRWTSICRWLVHMKPWWLLFKWAFLWWIDIPNSLGDYLRQKRKAHLFTWGSLIIEYRMDSFK